MANRFIDATIRLNDKMSGGLMKVHDKLYKTQKEASRTGRSIEKMGKSMQKTGHALTKYVTAPIIGIGIASVKASEEFEDSMAKVSTIADTTAVPMGKLEKQVLSLSNKLGMSVSDIAEAQYQAISAGVNTANSAQFVGVAAKAAKGGFTDTATAVDGLTTVLNSYGLSAKDATKISDQMLKTQDYGKTTFGELAQSMGRVIPTASAMKVKTQELFASMAVLTRNGIQTDQATTGLKAAYSNILKPSEKAAKYAKEIGLNFSASHMKSVGWVKFLGEIKEKTGGDADAMAKLFRSSNALNSMLVLTGKGSKDLGTAMDIMSNSSGATERAYKKMLTPAEKNRIAINKLKNSSIKMGIALTPMVTKVAGGVGRLADKISGLNDKQMDAVAKIGLVVAAAGPGLTIAGSITRKVGSTIKLQKEFTENLKTAAMWIKMHNLATAKNTIITAKNRIVLGAHVVATKAAAAGTATMTGAQRALNFAFVSTPIGWIVSGIAAVVVAGVLLYKNWDKVTKATKRLGKAFKTEFDGIGKFFTGLFNGMKAVFKGYINYIISGINLIPKGLNSIHLKIPDWVPKVGGKKVGFNLPTVPYLAKGTNNWQGGFAQIHEKGGEIVDLPRGTRVYPHDKSVKMAKQSGSINVTVNFNGVEIKDSRDIKTIAKNVAEEIGNELYRRKNNGEVVLT